MSDQNPFISVITPVYRAEDSLEILYTRVRDALEAHISANFEFLMVDDASPDRAWPVIELLVEQDARVRGIKLSRNFGQYMALTAGLEHARGEWIVILDCDLQDVPEEIPKLFAKAQEGYDVVLAQRIERQDSFLKKLSSKAFHAVFSYLTDTKQDPSTAQFGVYHRKVVNTLISMRERLRFLPAFIGWVGYRITAIPVRHDEGERGGSSYSFKKLMQLAFDTMIAFSDKPLRLTVKLGFGISLLSFLFALYVIYNALTGEPEPLGWTSLMVAVSFFSGLIIFIIGINGLYISRIFDEVKGRPLYIVQQVCENKAAAIQPTPLPMSQP
ncbi:MAG: glycosyl transferase family 2 [Vampirovibrio sp.]|jgi:dolichol-phosphate mannosyltransferase|nr:glycosyl transferase family 2 [Vampirovibrio sp.]